MNHIAILLYDGFTALDAIGPYEVLASIPDTKVVFVAERKGEVRSDTGRLGLIADVALADMTAPDVLLIPGGPGMRQAANETVLDWVRTAHQTTRWTTSVCTGSFVLGMAGLLEGKKVTTHWTAKDYTQEYGGASYVPERFVIDGKIITAAGVSAGIDMALFLAAELAGQATAEGIQLVLEYDPKPPFHTGSLATADERVVEQANRLLAVRPHKTFDS